MNARVQPPKLEMERQPGADLMDWRGRDVVSTRDFDRSEIDAFLAYAEKFIPVARADRKNDTLAGKVLCTLFYEPSTRTRLSFEVAMQRMGGSCIGFSDPAVTSNKKGETLSDTVRVADGLADVIVLRHPREGSARLAADLAHHPVINAGDGAGEHPTQTLLDLFTIRQERGKIDGNTIVLVGDLKFGRTVHSLAVALSQFKSRIVLASPPSLGMPREVLDECRARGANIEVATRLEDAIEEADVLYCTRIQAERFGDPEEYKKVAGTYRITPQMLARAKGTLIVMHPLPRVDEIHPAVDETPHAKYFQQAANGIPVRMALLAALLGGRP